MKKKIIILTGLLLLLGTFALYAQNLPTVRIVNNTGYDIFYVFISPEENEFWGNDLLGDDDILENGQTMTFTLPQPLNRVNVYDIRLVDEDGDSYFKMGLTLTNNARIVFTMDDLGDD
jgi:hypothetical protein